MIAFGESTTAGGWSSCRERNWVSHLSRTINTVQRCPVQVINMGIGANVISKKCPSYAYSGKPDAAERLEKHVLSNAPNGNPILPDLLIISYGLNDSRGGTPSAVFCEELEDIVRRVREKAQPLIVILGPYYTTDFELGAPHWSHANMGVFHEYNEAMRKLADKCDLLFVDLLSAFGEADWLVHSDGVHANDVSHIVVANKVFEVLASNCSGLTLETKVLEKQIEPWRDEASLQQ